MWIFLIIPYFFSPGCSHYRTNQGPKQVAQDHILYTQKLHEDVHILSQTFHLTLRRVCIRTKVISFSPTQEKGTAKNRSQEIEGDSQGRHLTKYLFSHTWTRSKRSISLLTGLSGLGTCDPCPDSWQSDKADLASSWRPRLTNRGHWGWNTGCTEALWRWDEASSPGLWPESPDSGTCGFCRWCEAPRSVTGNRGGCNEADFREMMWIPGDGGSQCRLIVNCLI